MQQKQEWMKKPLKQKAAISQASTNNDVDQAKTSKINFPIQPEIVKKAEAKKQLKMK